MGLRQKHKQDRLERILEAAKALFSQKSYGHAKAEEIAELAEVSIGTLYNYFGSKGDILLALAAIESENVFAHSEGLVTAPTGTAPEAVNALFNSYFDPTQSFLNADALQQSMAVSYANPDSIHARRLRDSDRLLCGQVVALLETLMADGRILAGTDCQIMGELLFNNMNMLFFEMVRSARKDTGQMRRKITDMTYAVVVLISPDTPRKGPAG